MPPPAFSQNPMRARSRAQENSPLPCCAGQSRVMRASRTTGIPFRRVFSSNRCRWASMAANLRSTFDRIRLQAFTNLYNFGHDHFGCRLRNSARQIFNCSSNALGIPETIFPSPDSPRTCIPSLISSSSDSGRLLQAWRWFQETVRGRLLVS